jgi:hypothetical protein
VIGHVKSQCPRRIEENQREKRSGHNGDAFGGDASAMFASSTDEKRIRMFGSLIPGPLTSCIRTSLSSSTTGNSRCRFLLME